MSMSPPRAPCYSPSAVRARAIELEARRAWTAHLLGRGGEAAAARLREAEARLSAARAAVAAAGSRARAALGVLDRALSQHEAVRSEQRAVQERFAALVGEAADADADAEALDAEARSLLPQPGAPPSRSSLRGPAWSCAWAPPP
eukprot:tig00000670_g3019.t1